jgi:hypothetical protein
LVKAPLLFHNFGRFEDIRFSALPDLYEAADYTTAPQTLNPMKRLRKMNVRMARALPGRGEIDLVVTVDGRVANTVRINVK